MNNYWSIRAQIKQEMEACKQPEQATRTSKKTNAKQEENPPLDDPTVEILEYDE